MATKWAVGRDKPAMNVRHILFPTDFSHYNDAALQLASTVAAESNAVLHIVHVDDMHDLNLPIAVSSGNESHAEPWDRTAVYERLERIVPPANGVQYIHHYLEGEPTGRIVEFSKRENLDLIVMASHGRTGLSRLLMGSVTEGVTRKAHCPVLVVKQLSAVCNTRDAESLACT
jgi:universal stress protein A